MSVTITHTPGVTDPGEIRKYQVTITDGTWAEFADILEDAIEGQRVWVTINDDVVLKFETMRERLSWSDGFRQGVRSATEETVIIDWLEQWLKKDTQKDEMEKESATRREGIYREKMSPKTAVRCAKLAQDLTRWRKS